MLVLAKPDKNTIHWYALWEWNSLWDVYLLIYWNGCSPELRIISIIILLLPLLRHPSIVNVFQCFKPQVKYMLV